MNPSLPLPIANAGNDYHILVLCDRIRLSSMALVLGCSTIFMSNHALTTISQLYTETPRSFQSQNAFVIGGVTENPATRAAALWITIQLHIL